MLKRSVISNYRRPNKSSCAIFSTVWRVNSTRAVPYAFILAGMVHNTAVVSAPRSTFCTFKHLELVSLQDLMVLLILVLNGARVRQLLITLDHPIDQAALTTLSNKLSSLYSGLNVQEISGVSKELGLAERENDGTYPQDHGR